MVDNPLDALLGYQLHRAAATMMADLAHSIEGLALTRTEASVLLLIAHNPGVTQSEIGRILAIQRANMAPIAAMLTDRGLLKRKRADGRSQGLLLNRAGMALAAELASTIAAHESKFLPDISLSDRQMLVGLLRRVWMPELP
jgi:DNA-binding MarR family transcriptional regulator